MIQAVSASIPQWFKAKWGVANGIIYAAGGLGGAVLSIALDALIKAVGVPWTFRIQGFMILVTGLPSALTLKTRYPIPPTRLVEWSVLVPHRLSDLPTNTDNPGPLGPCFVTLSLPFFLRQGL